MLGRPMELDSFPHQFHQWSRDAIKILNEFDVIMRHARERLNSVDVARSTKVQHVMYFLRICLDAIRQ